MNIDQHIIIRYFLGQTSEEEKKAIHQWIDNNEENRKRFIKERIRFDATILADEHQFVIRKQFELPSWLNWSWKVAACILLLLGSFSGYDYYRMNQLAETFQYVHVPPGNRTNIQLPDGTNVWLNANTTLHYPLAFTKKNREITLDGEGYFEVAKDKKPFIVKTNKYNIEVMGTTFNVEAYADKPVFTTILYTGKVKLYNAQYPEAIFLLPGQTASMNKDSLQISSTKNINSYRWKDGLIYIENQSFSSIMELFEKFYDIKIIVSNKAVQDLGYRGKLRISDGVDHALRVLQNDFPFLYERDEERNIIYIN